MAIFCRKAVERSRNFRWMWVQMRSIATELLDPGTIWMKVRWRKHALGEDLRYQRGAVMGARSCRTKASQIAGIWGDLIGPDTYIWRLTVPKYPQRSVRAASRRAISAAPA
jgi:hypothetical protein